MTKNQNLHEETEHPSPTAEESIKILGYVTVRQSKKKNG